jgi:hypothetical protein
LSFYSAEVNILFLGGLEALEIASGFTQVKTL